MQEIYAILPGTRVRITKGPAKGRRGTVAKAERLLSDREYWYDVRLDEAEYYQPLGILTFYGTYVEPLD